MASSGPAFQTVTSRRCRCTQNTSTSSKGSQKLALRVKVWRHRHNVERSVLTAAKVAVIQNILNREKWMSVHEKKKLFDKLGPWSWGAHLDSNTHPTIIWVRCMFRKTSKVSKSWGNNVSCSPDNSLPSQIGFGKVGGSSMKEMSIKHTNFWLICSGCKVSWKNPCDSEQREEQGGTIIPLCKKN